MTSMKEIDATDTRNASELKRLKQFKTIAKKFGTVDPKTKKFREACQALGFSVVFKNRLSDEETLKVLKSVRTKKIPRPLRAWA